MTTLQRLVNRVLHRAHELVEWYGAIAPGTDKGDAFGSLGEGACIAFPPGSHMGTSSIHVGERTLVGRGCTLSVGYTADDPHRPARGLVIGARCVVGARSTLTAHESIVLGDDVWLGQDVFVSDASHGYQDPETPIGLQLGAHQPVRIGSGTWIGHGAIVLPGAQVGRNVVVGAGSVVRGVVPDHSVVVGAPARVVRRLEPGVGWVSTDGSGDVRPALSADELAAELATLEESHPARTQLRDRLRAVAG
ncbi:acyltransferase [Nocardioides solisilvae]|uniref:acyltransferase n=1 Tax=Nocardioides solisilvae TaxID=1542435 RepID=UPI0023B7FF51|nr:acyltransferase [Nocardioides solisilvae]